MALELELDIVAEGIEDAGQMAALGELGCQYGQGYHIARPQNADRTIDYIRS